MTKTEFDTEMSYIFTLKLLVLLFTLLFASWFPTLISCSPNLPRVYIRLCKHGNHFIFLKQAVVINIIFLHTHS